MEEARKRGARIWIQVWLRDQLEGMGKKEREKWLLNPEAFFKEAVTDFMLDFKELLLELLNEAKKKQDGNKGHK